MMGKIKTSLTTQIEGENINLIMEGWWRDDPLENLRRWGEEYDSIEYFLFKGPHLVGIPQYWIAQSDKSPRIEVNHISLMLGKIDTNITNQIEGETKNPKKRGR